MNAPQRLGCRPSEALHTPGWSELTEFVDQERKAGRVYPAAENVFRAFELTPYAKVRVVILGQDPYHGEGQAHGLAFSVALEKLPPSRRKIRKELERYPEVAPPEAGTSKAGHARASSSSTQCSRCAGAPNSHRARGWEDFTDAVISAVNKKSDRVVLLPWGAAAQKKAPLVTNETHRVIRAAHRAARASAHNPLVTSGSFSRANTALVDAGQTEIKWDRSAPPVVIR